MVRVKIGRSLRTARPLRAVAAQIAILGVLLAGCADFSTEPPTETIQPSLSAAAMHPQDGAFPIPTTAANPTPTGDVPPSQSSGAASNDPCKPADTTIIAACLEAPWGLAVLPSGTSALVGERTTGKILVVAPSTDPTLVTTIEGIDATGDGGLLGIALSPHFSEDGLIYAYVTTATDNRILRIASGDTPKAIFTGIPKGSVHNGGRIEFGGDNLLYIATGDAGRTGAGADPTSLAGKVLRIDESGKPATTSSGPGTSSPGTSVPGGSVPGSSVPETTVPAPTTTAAETTPSQTTSVTPTPTPAADPLTAIYASGLVNPTGICSLGASGMGVLDRIGTADLLLPVTAGAQLPRATPVWSFEAVDGGGVDCADNSIVLAATSLDQQLVTSLTLGPNGGFSGQPEKLAKDTYGRLLSLEVGTQGLLWATSSNKDGHGQPQPRDDMVIVIPTSGGGGGNGKD